MHESIKSPSSIMTSSNSSGLIQLTLYFSAAPTSTAVCVTYVWDFGKMYWSVSCFA